MNTRKVKKAILDVYNKLDTKECWTVRAFARSKDQCHVLPTATTAVSWCLLGAIKSVCFYAESYTGVFTEIHKHLPKGFATLESFNDKSTFRQVRALLRRTMNDLGISYKGIKL